MTSSGNSKSRSTNSPVDGLRRVKDPLPPGLTLNNQRLLEFLPDIYHTDFMSRFLGLFESVLIPIEWNIGNFDLFLSPGTASQTFLLWLANWLDIKVGSGWDQSRHCLLLSKAHELFARGVQREP